MENANAILERLGFGGKRLVAYGAGVSLLQMRAILPLEFEYAVDDTPGLAGTQVDGVPILPPSHLENEFRDDLLIIVLANLPASILAITDSLNARGFVWGENYIDCSVLHFETMAPRLSAMGITPNHALFSRVRLLSFYSAVRSMSYAAGSWLFAELIGNLPQTGAVAECGVYNGGNALTALLSSAAATQRRYRLLDSFQGFPELSAADPSARAKEFRDVNFARVRDLFRNFPNVEIHQGYFAATLPSLPEDRYSLVYMDCDLYEPTLELCEYFYPRVVPGGFLLWHDFWVPDEDRPHVRPFRGVNQAVCEFLGRGVDRLVVFPETTHALLRR